MDAYLLLTLVLLLPLSASAQNTGNVPLRASITADGKSNPWLSSSGDFAFGFRQINGSTDLFVLAIWFDKIRDKTIVWYVKDSYPVPRGSTVRLDAEQGIVLQDPQGISRYTSNRLNGQVVNGFMNDTGNFVLRGRNSTSLWESFNNPTDTILPTQAIGINGQIVSRARATEFSPGRFYGRMLSDGNFVLNTKSFPESDAFDVDSYYYTTKTNDPNETNSGHQLVFRETAMLSIVRRNGQRADLSPRSLPSASDNYYRATLDSDGVFVQYYHPKSSSGNSGWTLAASWPENICTFMEEYTGSGACGFNSLCRLESRRPVCECPRPFSWVDLDCKPNYVQYCLQGNQGSSNDQYELSVIPDVDWPKNDYARLKPSTEEQCRNLCLSDCFCAAAILRDGQCWIKSLPLSNGRFDSSIGSKGFLKYRKGNGNAPPSVNPNGGSSDEPNRDNGTLFLVLWVLLGSSIFINFSVIGAGCLRYYLFGNRRFRTINPPLDTSQQSVHCFAYKELVQATDAFKEEVGRGSFGIVYKGVIPNDSKTIIAVKKLDRVAQDLDKEFKAEVSAIGQTHHKHLVRLIGFCSEGPHRLLVYEYMSNGTLAGFLFGDMRPSWSQRMQIALGIARGLTYLHEECNTQIIHCDIKPQNILLDDRHNARISDFGLAKILAMNQSRTLTNIRGTKGYVAPEWFKNSQITAKVDVYSFGVVLLEIITCRKNVSQNQEFADEENPIMTDWVWDCFNAGRLDSIVGNDEEALSDKRALKRYVMIGIWCIQEDASKRPTMREAYQMLEGIVEVEVPPCSDTATFTSYV